MAYTEGCETVMWSGPLKVCRSPDWSLQLDSMKSESLVIAGQNTAVNTFPAQALLHQGTPLCSMPMTDTLVSLESEFTTLQLFFLQEQTNSTSIAERKVMLEMEQFAQQTITLMRCPQLLKPVPNLSELR